MSKSVPRTHRGPGRWIWSSLLVMLLLGPCGACWGLTKGLYESSGNTPGPRPYNGSLDESRKRNGTSSA